MISHQIGADSDIFFQLELNVRDVTIMPKRVNSQGAHNIVLVFCTPIIFKI